MPAGYRMSSGNNARLVAAGRRFRGSPTDTSDSSHLPNICPIGALDEDVSCQRWGGHDWSPWVPLTAAIALPGTAAGVYRVRGGDSRIAYIGEGTIVARLAQHRRSASTGSSPQGQAVAAGTTVDVLVGRQHGMGAPPAAGVGE